MNYFILFLIFGCLFFSEANVIKQNKSGKGKLKQKHRDASVNETVTFVIPIQLQQHGTDSEDYLEENEIEATTILNEVIIQETHLNASLVLNQNTSSSTTVAPASVFQNITQKIRFPCSCVDGQCGCCTGPILQRFNFKGCGNLSFIPEEFVFDVRMSVNNNTVVRRKVSVSDPPPICFNPARAPFVEVCAEIYNVHVKDRTANGCMDIEANVGGFPIYSRSFECFSLGPSGLKTGQDYKPIKNKGPKPVSLFPSDDDDDDEGGIFGGDDDGDFLPDFGGDDDSADAGGGEEGLFEASDLGAFADVFGGSKK